MPSGRQIITDYKERPGSFNNATASHLDDLNRFLRLRQLSVTHSAATEPCRNCAQALPSGKNADGNDVLKALNACSESAVF